MKRFAMAAMALFMACVVASAQYFCSTPGTVLTLKSTDNRDKSEETYKVNVTEVVTGEDGIVTATYQEVHPIPGNRLAELTFDTYYTYNPGDSVTTYIMLTPESFKSMLETSIREMSAQAGQPVSEAQLHEIFDKAKITGNISIPIPQSPAADTKFANSTLRCTMMGQIMSMRLTKGFYKGNESVETAAGTFDCVKLTCQLITPDNGIEYETYWVAPGIGVIKSLTCNKKGDVLKEEVLESITRPE